VLSDSHTSLITKLDSSDSTHDARTVKADFGNADMYSCELLVSPRIVVRKPTDFAVSFLAGHLPMVSRERLSTWRPRPAGRKGTPSPPSVALSCELSHAEDLWVTPAPAWVKAEGT